MRTTGDQKVVGTGVMKISLGAQSFAVLYFTDGFAGEGLVRRVFCRTESLSHDQGCC